MNVKMGDLQSALADAQNPDSVTTLVFVLRDPPTSKLHPPGFSLRRVQMESSIAEELRVLLARWLDRLIAPDVSIVEFLPFAETQRDRLEAISVAKVPGAEDLVRRIAAAPPTAGAIDDELLNRLWAYAVVVTRQGRRTILLRRFLPTKVIRVGGPLKFLLRQGVLSRIDHLVFNLDDNADALVVGEDILVLQKTLFEQIFDYVREVYTPLADKAMIDLRKVNILSDPEAFEDACRRDDNKLKKLADISQNVNPAKLTWDDIRQVQSQWGLPVRLDFERQWIVFEPAVTWTILRLFDDDYLRSDMTGGLYEVHSKRLIKRQRRPVSLSGKKAKASAAPKARPRARTAGRTA